MKKSEMEKLLLNGLCDLGQWYEMSPEQVARALCILLQPKEGWETEEPGLPKRLVLKRLTHEQALQEDGWRDGDIPWLIPDGEPWWTKEQMFAGFEAALSAYNERESLLRQKENIQRCADRSDQLVDRWKGVVEKALTEARSACPSFTRILDILEERDPDEVPGAAKPLDPDTVPREVVVAYENLRKFFLGSGV